MRDGVRRLVIAEVLLVAAVAAVAACGREGSAGRRASADGFVGSAACGACHATEYQRWRSAQHAVAMRPATGNAVLGNFDDARVAAAGVVSTFTRRGTQYVVNTRAADGSARDVIVRRTFGVFPLQQYLVEYGGGRLQALTLAWDARPAAAGGGRWFSLAPDEVIEHGSAQRWTGRGFNWNYMCADCHSTAVRKNYVPDADSFHTTSSEISVGCEACHGPGAAHAAWGTSAAVLRRPNDGRLPASLVERRGVKWELRAGARTAARSAPRTTDNEIETCAQCHARRVHIADGYTAGKPLLDYYIPALLTADLYHPDGQQREEVYTYGSFLQSKMYAAGVTCSDCHDPHSGQTRRAGNSLCTQCHVASAYDTAAHHFHRAASAGARCVSCHMPDTAYMQIDPRHDHSLRVPRPDLSVTLGVPNACSRCHTDRDARWAADVVRRWYPRSRSGGGHQRFAMAFALDDARRAGAADSLLRVASDTTEPAIARGSALARLGAYGGARALASARVALRDSHPLVRLGALQLLESAPDGPRRDAASLLRDPRRALRQGAAWVLAPVRGALPASDREAFARAATEFVASQRYNADQPEDRLALGAFYAQLGALDSAAAEYRAALRLEPRLSRAAVFLAAVLRARGRLQDALAVLDSALSRDARDHDVLLALATYHAEAGDTAAAMVAARALVHAYPQDARGRELLQALAR